MLGIQIITEMMDMTMEMMMDPIMKNPTTLMMNLAITPLLTAQMIIILNILGTTKVKEQNEPIPKLQFKGNTL